MTAVAASLRAAGPTRSASPVITAGTTRAGVPWLVALVAGYPVLWALGLAPLAWSLIGVPMALALVGQRRLAVPRGSSMWALFLIAMVLSTVQLGSFARLGTWTLRASWYLSATAVLLYVLNHPSRRTVITTVRCLVGLWTITAIGGWLGVLAPRVRWTGPVAAALPSAILQNGLVADMTSPILAELQGVGGRVALARPAAPFPYTNSWGSTLALLTPFVIMALADRRVGLPRGLVVAMLAAAVVPFVLALNRGSWLTLGLGVVYGLVGLPPAARRRARRWLLGLCAAGLLLAVTTGLASTVHSQVAARSTDSDETRSNLYAEAVDGAVASPLLGYGAPRRSEINPDGPPVGTHGQLWMVLYSHGFIAAACFAGFFVVALAISRPENPILLWTRVALLIGLLQLPIYGHLPQQLFIMMLAVALIHRVNGVGPLH